MSDARVVIGLEVHLQLATRSKMFCGCPVGFGGPPNSRCCPVCLGHPGALPVANRAALELGLRGVLALGGEAPAWTRFDRKHYVYPDLPKGYQITQLDHPIGRGGRLDVETDDGGTRAVRVRRIHLEEDSGRSEHGEDGSSLVDFDRAGIPLLEIVTEPDLRSPAEAERWLRALREIAVHVGVSEASMEKGQLRGEANVNLCHADGRAATPIVEIKNLNSFANVRRAMEHEIERQRELLERDGERAAAGAPSTRGFDEATGRTVLQREKEDEADYRYFPDPDLPPLRLDPAWIEALRRDLPEPPAARRDRWREAWGLAAEDADVLGRDPAWARLFEQAVAAGAPPRAVAAWLRGEVRRAVDETGRTIARLDPVELAVLVRLVEAGEITRATGRDVLREALATGRGPTDLVAERRLERLEAGEELGAAIEAAVASHPGAAADYAAGKDEAIGPLVGAVLRVTGGRADPGAVRRELETRLRRG